MPGVPVVPGPYTVHVPLPQGARWYRRHVGYLYLAWTLSTSAWYLAILDPSATNDHWWPSFATRTTQTFLGDVFNAQLRLGQTGAFSLCSDRFSMAKSYAAPATFMDVDPASPRRILQSTTSSMETAIAVMRTNTLDINIRMFAQYCWADLDRRYELSTSAGRASRCQQQYRDNAGVYLEAMLRNVDAALLTTDDFAMPLQVAVFRGIAAASSAGKAWVAAVMTHTWLSVADEVAHWRGCNLSYWRTQVTNYYQQGLQSSIVIVNALGHEQRVTIAQISFVQRPLSQWTFASGYNGFWNDLWQCEYKNCSLVRGIPPILDDWESINYGTSDNASVLISLVHNHIGSFGNLDLTLVQIPAALATLFFAVQAMQSQLRLPEVAKISVGAVPPSWRLWNATYFGGNPMCIGTSGQTFVQPPIGFYDACATESEDVYALDTAATFFAIVAMSLDKSQVADVCSLCSDGTGACTTLLTTTLTAVPDGTALAQMASSAVANLSLSMLQFASVNDTPVFLEEALFPAAFTPWTFFSWTILYDWLQGRREVYQLEGNVRSFTLPTRRHDYLALPANPLEMPQKVCLYIWYMVFYITLLLGAVIVCILVCRDRRSRASSYDLFFYNRVVGSIWIGRPLLLLRGCSALALLSTSPVVLSESGGMTKFIFEPRSLPNIMIIASEATWVSYVLVDFLLPLTGRFAKLYAPYSSSFAWSILVLWEVASPYEAIAIVGHDCDIVELGHQARCTGGTVAIGSWTHFLGGSLVTVICVLLPIAIGWVAKGRVRLATNHALVPAAADVFLSHARSFSSRLDSTTAIMTGIIPLRRKLFDIKIWLVLDRPQLANMLPQTITNPMTTTTSSRLVNPTRPNYALILRAIAGVIYTFIYVSETAMANDFIWASFGSSSHQTFLANWFSRQLQITSAAASVDVTKRAFADDSNAYNESSTTVQATVLYASMIQDEANSLANVIAERGSIADEVLYWERHSISHYVGQWQTYKTLGAIQTYSIQNAVGVQYPLMLRYSNSSLHPATQTSFKMQLPLASYFWHVTSNASLIVGRSLLRQSPHFAFANISIVSLLITNETLTAPLDPNLALVQNQIGPFGANLLLRVTCPPVLRQWYEHTHAHLMALASANETTALAFRAIGTPIALSVIPIAWMSEGLFTGGSVLCPSEKPRSVTVSSFGPSGPCALGAMEELDISNIKALMALIAVETPTINASAICVRQQGSPAACTDMLSNAAGFLRMFVAAPDSALVDLSSAAQRHVTETVSLKLVQFTDSGRFLQTPVFADEGFRVFAWSQLIDWVLGLREVVTFLGEEGSVTTISTLVHAVVSPVNPLEVPVNVALYCRYVLLYITSVLIIVAVLALAYLASNKGFLEGANLFALNRVLGLVWIGRPLLLLRGATALCLLATASVHLTQISGLYYLVAVPQAWYSTVMAAGETGWLVFILNDAFSVVTRQYTAVYATQSNLLVWAATAIWTLLSPVAYTVSIQNRCAVVALDAQLVCHAGVFAIGSTRRLLSLLGLICALLLIWFVVQRLRFPHLAPLAKRSYLLYATARYHFATDEWTHKQIYYIDQTSAVLTGLVSLRCGRVIYVLDIKSWRVFAIDATSELAEVAANPSLAHLRDAIPLKH
ncbi:hypothetical protein SDRG_01097 [Saprolegnia diclina VS20]|uniref:Uncharacterized protein n=1 Tax=Saprolegnia diclina (strain VS20) TaxID=1156394 RepID=T0S7M7_SAPDV|nr:hypothetical protein SDRG_01097 [Saprolegnia diclina VS20]EQC41118.1 hypothetical protein SDRG_01097 [Saprolegnia diclina VS20]|eukprot:XP_008604832.1 hypothetical protein SDRG_01097 [Saprolegnia diclina VS20]